MSSDQEDVHAGGPRKRRRLNTNVQPSSEDVPEPSSDSPQSLHEEPGALHESEPQERPKPRHKIHLVQNAAVNLAEDGIYTQPPATEEDHRIRGAHWVKARPQPVPLPQVPSFSIANTAALAPRSRASAKTHTGSLAGAVTRQSPPPGRAMPREVSPAIHEIPDEDFGDDVEAALLEELAGFGDEELQNIGRADADPQDVTNLSDQEISSQDLLAIQEAQRCDILVAPRNNLRQTTLFGVAVRDDGTATQASQSNRVRNWPEANREEPATHHKLDDKAMETWVYPTNLGTIRDYQFNIVSRGLYHNLLVALPTGLGKTFIAATIMLNWFRWTKDSQIVFMAPTKPLVAQQVDACFNIAGIPRSTTTLLTGQTPPALRAEEWESRRVFFMTPQTFNNDLKSGACDPKKIVLVVVDEAHRATGNYSYCEVIAFLRRFNTSFRVLALTATPGSTVEAVQQVIDGLGIARTEIRTEDSLDIRQYVHHRNIDTEVFQYNEDMERVMELISPAIQPVLNKVASMSIYHSKDPMAITAYGCMMARQKWQKSPAGRSANFGLKGMVNSIFNVLASLGHALGLLKFHGIGPFFHKICKPSDTDKKENKYERQIREHPDFKKMLAMCRMWTSNPEFLGHPKLEYLSSVVLNHFIDRGEGRDTASGSPPSATRIMIFAHYRDSAEEIVRVLRRHAPMVRPHIFVGQANTSGSDGMDQKKQIDIIDKFKKGTYNTLVATSIGEEGLDIGEVDLIVCYDASASPIRMLQRMGRTGRKRAGNIVVLLMEKKEKDDFEKAKDNYEKMQQMIADGSRFTYHDALSPRIVPKGIVPVVDKRAVEIPIENSQADLPEPKKRKGKLPKRPPKKFHMPDNVITGFVKASNMGGDKPTASKRDQRARSPTPDPVPDIEKVLLTDWQNVDLEERFLNISGEQSEVVEYPGLNKHALLQRRPRPTRLLKHGWATNKTIKMFKTMRGMDEDALQDLQDHLHPDDKELADRAYVGEVVMELENEPAAPEPAAEFDLGIESEPEIEAPKPAKRKQPVQKAPPAKKQKTTPKAKAPAKAKPVKNGPKSRIAPATKSSKKRATKMPSPSQQDSSDMEAPPSPTQHPSSHADIGIDIMNTDDDNDPNEDDDDDGSDLIDFIDDGAQVEHVPSSSDSLMAVSRRKSKVPKQRRPIRRAIEPSSDQEEDEGEGLPNLEDLLGPVQRAKPRRERGRKVVIDSDDED